MSDDIKKGLMGVIVDETAISKVMPEINSLTYRGYAAQDLCAKCQFEEVAYLILNGELPNKKEYKKFVKEEVSERSLSKNLLNVIKQMPKKSHPMDVARTAVSFMGLEDKETVDNSPNANLRKIFVLEKSTTIINDIQERPKASQKVRRLQFTLQIKCNLYYLKACQREKIRDMMHPQKHLFMVLRQLN